MLHHRILWLEHARFFMNQVKIKFDPFQDKCTIAMNDVPLAVQCDLDRYLNQSLLVSGQTLLEELAEELNAEYDLTVVGTDFEKFFTGDLKRSCADCRVLSAETIDIVQRYEEASKMMVCDTEDYKERVYVGEDQQIGLDERFVMPVSDLSQATICIAANGIRARMYAEDSKAKLILYPAEEAAVTYVGKGRCLWGMKPTLIPRRLQAAAARFAIPAYLRMATLREQKEETVQTVRELKRVDVCVHVSVPAEAIEGDVLCPVFHAEGQMPYIRMESANPQVIQVLGGELSAVGEGTAKISFYKDSEVEAFETVHIQVKADTFLKTILLDAPGEMKAGQTYRITASCLPADSPEISNLQWSVTDPDVADIDAAGNLHARRDGTTTVVAKAARTEGRVDISIIPGLDGIVLSKNEVTVGIARYEDIEVNVEPANCREEIVCRSTNPEVAVAEKNDQGQWQIRGVGVAASGNGTCELIFSGDQGRCQAVCKVTVFSSLRIKHRNSLYFPCMTCLTLGTIVMRFLEGSVGRFGSLAFGVLTAAVGVLSVIKKRWGAIWEIILAALSIWIAVSGFIG